MDYSKESMDRQQKIRDLKEAWVICYANNYRWKQDIDKIRELSEKHLKDVDFLMENWAVWEFKTAGRLISSRGMWKLVFWKLRDNSADIQICFARDKVVFNTGRELVESIVVAKEEKSAFKIAEKFCQVWDIIWVVWDLFVTKHGELTIFVREFQIMSKAVRPLPEKFHWLQDQETIYRQRYLDLITNTETYDRFMFRSKFIKAAREFYWKNDFVEIETPILGNAASWAAAKPFITHHNDFDEDYFLRIAPETALKKATVGRYERVFEIGKNFRNEWSDPSHMQEFSVIEHYAAWWNYEDNMRFTEELFDHIFTSLNLNREIEIKDKDWNARMVNFTTPWQRIDYIEWVNKASWLDITSYKEGDEERLIADIKAKGIQFDWMDNMVVPTLIDYLYKKVLRPSITWPAFVYNYPKLMQPLARQSDMDEKMVEQFQVLVNGWEILKAYSELVDPKVQQENFDAQSGAVEKWDEEATSGDDDFVLSMEYGMPPQSGWWMGIDRIVSLLTEQENLRDVVLFPLMKSEKRDLVMWEAKTTKIAVAIINKNACSEKWQELNTVWHLSASFAAREWKQLFYQDKFSTHDGHDIKLNIQHALQIKETDNQQDLLEVLKTAKKHELEVAEFTREMMETSDDKKIESLYKQKDYKDIEHMWVLIFGDKKLVEKLTKNFNLYK